MQYTELLAVSDIYNTAYLVYGNEKPAPIERFQPLAFPSSGQTGEEERLIIDGEQDGQAQPAAHLGPTQTAPETVGRPSGTQKPPRDARHL